MRFKIIFIFISFFIVFSDLKTQDLDIFQLENLLKKHVSFLASDSLEGRGLGTNGKVLAKNYIADKFTQFGLLPFHETGYFQDFYLRMGMARVPATNVVGYLKGNDPELQDEYIVIGAHYDHLGVEENKDEIKIFHGADDNASGVATVIELARYFSENRDFLKRSIIFVAFDAEESGLLGSEHFVQSGEPVSLKNIKLMFSLDMVGMYNANKGIDMEGILLIEGGGKLAEDIARSFQIRLKELNDEVVTNTDTKPFGDEGIPAIHVFTGMNSPYHKPQDTYEKLDYAGMALITSYLGSLISEMSNSPDLKAAPKMEKQQKGKEVIKFHSGVSLLAGSSNHRFPDRFYRAKSVFGYGVGLYGELILPKGFGIQPEMFYLGDGSKSEPGTFRRHSVMVPLNFNYYLLNQNNGIFTTFVFGGPYYLRSFGGQNGGTNLDFEHLLNEEEWGFQFGFGMDIMKWRIRGYWLNGVTNLQKNPDDILKSRGAYLSLGYRF